MSRNVTPLIDIVRLEDKETKLKAFIAAVVAQAAASGSSANDDMLLIARSIESPVVKAVTALVQDGTITSPVRTILAIVAGGTSGPTIETLLSAARANGARVVRDQRLFDAHEQLVFGPAASWIGDCMRRDPMKRDAYECYAADCSKTAGWARLSFERLWAACEPMVEDIPAPGAVAAAGILAAVAAEESSDGHSGSSAD